VCKGNQSTEWPSNPSVLFDPYIAVDQKSDVSTVTSLSSGCVFSQGYVIYLLTAVGLSPGGSTHLHTNNT